MEIYISKYTYLNIYIEECIHKEERSNQDLK